MIEMTLEMAEKAVKAAQAKAKDLGTPITVTVVDEAGRLVLCARGDGTGFLTPETSRGKAMASVAFRRPTKAFEENLAKGSEFIYQLTLDGMIGSQGGIPLIVGGKLIGAIGCSGGTGPQDLQTCTAGAGAL